MKRFSSEGKLGGAKWTHATNPRVTIFTLKRFWNALLKLRKLISSLPQNCEEVPKTTPLFPKFTEFGKSWKTLFPSMQNQPYDMRHIINELIDGLTIL